LRTLSVIYSDKQALIIVLSILVLAVLAATTPTVALAAGRLDDTPQHIHQCDGYNG